MWRLEDGQAVLVAYEIYRGSKNQFGKIPGVLGRGERGVTEASRVTEETPPTGGC